MSELKISTVLTRAARYIEKHGLAKGTYFKYRNGHPADKGNIVELVEKAFDKGCRACAWGGLYVGAYRPGVTPGELDDATNQAARYLGAQISTGGWGIAAWNDRDERTQDEVVQTLKDAARAARKDGK